MPHVNQNLLDAMTQKHNRELERCIQAGIKKCNALLLQHDSPEMARCTLDNRTAFVLLALNVIKRLFLCAHDSY
jgi:hypothetical protein